MKTSTEHLREDLEAQFELPHFPPPMTANRAKDYPQDCKRCMRPCGYCEDMRQHHDFDYLGR